MKYIKIFESFDIEAKLKEFNIKNYTINPDGSIDVDGDVCLQNMKKMGGKLPFNFNNVTGNFYCYDSGLNTLEGSPRKVGGMFLCSGNQLTSLIGAPNIVGHEFNCHSNLLTTLMGGPEEVGDNYICSDNELETLEGCALEIGGLLECTNNLLTKLDTVSNVNGDIYCAKNNINIFSDGFMGWCGGKIKYEGSDG